MEGNSWQTEVLQIDFYCYNNFEKNPKQQQDNNIDRSFLLQSYDPKKIIILMCGEQSSETWRSKCTDVWTMQTVALHETDANDSQTLIPERK